MPRPALVITLLIVLALAAPARAQWPLTSCTTLGKNLFVRDVLTDLYLWFDEMPGANPGRHATPEGYLEALRYRPLDSTFSYLTSRAASDAFFTESRFVGIGISTAITAEGHVRVLQVFPGSPAAEAGFSRGDRILEIDGVPVSLLAGAGAIDAAFGPADAGAPVDLVVADRAGIRRAARLVKRPVTIPTVSLVRVLEAGGRRVGYIFFRNFVEPSHAALDDAFATLAAARVDDLVLDVRYNGGGLVSVAQHLASLIGGVRTDGQVFARYVHNDRNTYRNEVLRFDRRPGALSLDRLIVITTRASASASELVINALTPFMRVVIVGDRTYGKPVGQYQVPFCDKLLAPVSFSMRNADGEGDFFGGLPPTCAAPDDLEHELGDPAEGSLREALRFASTGSCTPRPGGSTHLSPGAGAAHTRAAGWQAVINAY